MPPHCAAACQKARPLNGEPGAATVRSRLSPGVGAGAACSPFFGRGAASAAERTAAADRDGEQEDGAESAWAHAPTIKRSAEAAPRAPHSASTSEWMGKRLGASSAGGAAVSEACTVDQLRRGGRLRGLRRRRERDRLRFGATQAPWEPASRRSCPASASWRRSAASASAGIASRGRRSARRSRAASKSSATRCGLRNASNELSATGRGSMKPRKRRASTDSGSKVVMRAELDASVMPPSRLTAKRGAWRRLTEPHMLGAARGSRLHALRGLALGRQPRRRRAPRARDRTSSGIGRSHTRRPAR